jgi:NAD(P)-dependent dehydrogenase (short-subunit alcohol dehydrogenase family)
VVRASLVGQVVIVTGATGRLGTAVCKVFLAADETVVAVYRRDETLSEFRDMLGGAAAKVAFEKADTTKPGDMDRVAANVAGRLGRIDILVNTVGGYMTGAVQETDAEEFDRAIDLNLKSAFLSCKAVIAPMRSRSAGSIVNVSSRVAFHGEKDQFLYAAGKAGVLRLTESLSEELKDSGVRVNAIVPKVIDTPENRAMMPKAKWDRWPTPEQVARVVRWLCSEDSGVVTGAAIPVYGRA